MTKIKAKNNF